LNNPREIPRYTLTRVEAARSLGISLDSFEEYVQGELRLVRVGRLVLVPVAELERWVAQNAARTLEAVS
jgi:excisionase family DNA binding protein